MQAAEIELKFPVHDIAGLRREIAGHGFKLATERTLETNTLYDTPERVLRDRHQILRLRHYGNKSIVTHKRQDDAAEVGPRYKTRIETESVIEDIPALAEIFAQLGFGPVFRYEKYREEWASQEGKLVIDETAIGTWAELEGAPGWIDATLAALRIDPDQCLTDSYGKLFLRWKEEQGSSVENLTFEEIGDAVAR